MPVSLHLDNYYLHRIALWYRDGYARINREPGCIIELSKNPTFAILGENEPLRDALITALEWDNAVRAAYASLTEVPRWHRVFNLRRYRAAKCHLHSCVERRDAVWNEYEVIRKLTCLDNTTLRVCKFKLPVA